MEKPDPNEAPEARKERVQALATMVKEDIDHWKYAFDRMRKWRRFARGLQWPGSRKEDLADPERNYVANVTMRHLKQRTAAIYAKNPTFRWRSSERLHSKVWDGTAQQLMRALEQAQMSMEAGMPADDRSTQIISDAVAFKAESEITEKLGRTNTVLYTYFWREQIPPAKKMAKKQVLTALTCGVAYFKQSFQRAMENSPDQQNQLSDHRSQLARIERLAGEMEEGEVTSESAKAEELRELIRNIEESPEIIVREGLAIDYPDSLNIIPDRNMTYLPGFVGCGHVTEQYCLTPEQVREIYGVDIKSNFTEYSENSVDPGKPTQGDSKDRTTARVWEIWDRTSNMMCVICDGYPDYIVEPHAPKTYTERFYPWFVFAPNAVDDDEDPFPPSDVELMMPQQMEINRAGEALRDHRFAARPGHVTAGNLPEDDRLKIFARKAHDIMTLKFLKPEERIQDKLQAFPTSPIDPNLYQTGPAFQDILRSVGTQEANLGGVAGGTATESTIAESSRQSTLASAMDEFDDLLTEMARAGGQILAQEMSKEKVLEIVGPGAVWPESPQSRKQLAEEIRLEVEAGSSGRPNQAQEVTIRERIYPLLMQLPGLKPEYMVKDLLRTMDDRINYEDAIDMDMLPIQAMNGQMQASANRGEMGADAGGAQNAPGTREPSSDGPPRSGQAMPGGVQPVSQQGPANSGPPQRTI